MNIKKVCLTALTISLAACGGGSSSSGSDGTIDTSFVGNSSAATASSSNAPTLARAASEGALQAAATVDAPIGYETNLDELNRELNAQIIDMVLAGDTPIAATETTAGNCGGEIRVTTPDYSSFNPGDTYSASAVYDNYCVGYGSFTYVINGSYYSNINTRNDGSISRAIYSFDYEATSNYGGEGNVIRYSATQDCAYNSSSQQTSCTISDNFTGVDGRSYRVENFEGDEYDLSARIYDQDYGYFDIEASSLGYACDNGNFSFGSITIEDSSGNEVISVTFPNCNDCVVTYGGTANTYSQIFD
jgi:hypothetical protein